ncbi:transposase [Streptomyces sp. TG1A-60]|uniref:transposase n=1 Tax=Streptomyces sp. TG1A-60 TaxID=3129111 RepID=UPI0030CE37AF
MVNDTTLLLDLDGVSVIRVEQPHDGTPFITTGHSNAKSEGINRVIKLVAGTAFGFRNADHQRLRTRCVTTRRARGHLRTAQL